MISKLKRGFTMVEIIVVVAVIAILSVIIVSSFSEQTKVRALQGEQISTLAILDQARSLAMSSKENTDFGVHFSTTAKTLFEGSTYNASDPDNIVEEAAFSTQIVNISLNGGGDSVVFDRLTGRTNEYGTIDIQSTLDGNESSTITIYQTGLIGTD